jgi:DNA-binding GntR family transcriptional regulator
MYIGRRVIEPVGGQPLWQTVLERLRAAILDGELRPGEKLVETDLAERLGTSRGPVREAIRELVREGLVMEFPRRGNVVSTLTANDLIEVYAVREALETAVARLVATQVTENALAELDAWLDRLEHGPGDYLEKSVSDLAFHRTLVALAGNRRMTAINEQMLSQTAHLLRIAGEVSPALQAPMRPEAHRKIVAGLRARDADAVREAIATHYRYAEERLFPGLA